MTIRNQIQPISLEFKTSCSFFRYHKRDFIDMWGEPDADVFLYGIHPHSNNRVTMIKQEQIDYLVYNIGFTRLIGSRLRLLEKLFWNCNQK